MKEIFPLNEGEEIIREIKPLKRSIITNSFWYFVVISVISFFIFLTIWEFFFSHPLFFVLLVALLILLSIVLGAFEWRQAYYWITNQRVVVKRGIIGYNMTFVPFKRISDLIVKRDFLEMLLGISTLKIQSLAGQIGAEEVLSGLKDAEEIRSLILKLIKR